MPPLNPHPLKLKLSGPFHPLTHYYMEHNQRFKPPGKGFQVVCGIHLIPSHGKPHRTDKSYPTQQSCNACLFAATSIDAQTAQAVPVKNPHRERA